MAEPAAPPAPADTASADFLTVSPDSVDAQLVSDVLDEAEVAVAEPVTDSGPDAVVIPDNPPPPEIVPDGPCEPDCSDRVCGSDGCGGICGYCAYPTVCDAEGACVEVCEPDCDNKFCGNDGCGGVCGECPDGLECGLDGLCYEPTCVPDCTGKVCGADGCGADCGLCVSPEVCDQGACQLGPCGTVTEVGECDGDLLRWCEDSTTLNEDDCSNYDYVCVYDGQLGQYTCKEPGQCVPNCSGKECGADGCGGQCGACNDSWSCEVGTCTPQDGGACGPFQGVNGCIGDDLFLCQASGTLLKVACNVAPLYETCGFDFEEGKYACVGQ